METLELKRIINNQNHTITLSDDELERAYRIMERRYLDEDFANYLADEIQNPNCHFHSGHLEEFPELTEWLCNNFDSIFDANMAHNDLITLAIRSLEDASLTPTFFNELAVLAPAFCDGTEKNVYHCEEKCPSYYHCSNITKADDRSKKWELLGSYISMHNNGTCSCHDTPEAFCPAKKYLSQEWDIHDYFHYTDGMEDSYS